MRQALVILSALVVMPLVVLAVGPGDQPPTPPPTLLPRRVLDAELGVPIGAPLASSPVTSAPVMDGVVDAVWADSTPLEVPLHLGLHGDEPAGVLELRSLYDQENVYFLASWPAASPGGEPGAWRNLLTVHWRLVDPGLVSGESTGSEGLACTVACHTATADGDGRLVGIRSETIPPGLDDDLHNGGGWEQGQWTLEWNRPRVSTSPYDQHMVDAAQTYRLFVKLFEGREGRADPVSDVHELRLAR